MKKSVFLLVLSIFILHATYSYPQDTTRIRGGYILCTYDNEVYGAYKEKYRYDNNGHMISFLEYYIDYGKTLWNKKIRQNFDNNGNIIEYAKYTADYYYDLCNLKEKEIWKYDTTGRLVENWRYDYRDTLNPYNICSYKYDDRGNMIEERIVNSNGDEEKKIVWKYNAAGIKIESVMYDSIGSVMNKEKFNYDEKGNKTDRIMYDANGSVIRKASWQYYENGKKKMYACYEYNNALGSERIVETWLYDVYENKIECQNYDIEGKVWYTIKYQYDGDGNMIQEETSGPGNNVTLRNYIYSK